jgi:SAM-dependent methyltransferase
MENDEALRQWNSAARGWAKWEPVHNTSLSAATEVMLNCAGVTEGSRVIDIACGAGNQTLAAARRAGTAGSVLATDISPTMLDFVAAHARAAGLDNIATQACAAENLPRDQGQFDAAICRLGLMLMPNPGMVVAAVRDVLRPGGRFGALVVGPPETNPFYAEPIVILRRHAGKPAPASGPGINALADRTVLAALFESAGFTDITVTTVDSSLAVPSVEDAIQCIQEAAGAIRGIIADQPQAVQDAAWAEARAALTRFETAGGLVAPAQYHVVGGLRPT